ncbi:MAG: ketoacyl-ACP synthase III [Elusimicrobiota bacterium]|nr:ketoacyl-ACP synthase III [Elusimicrobiota bacterium]
MSIRIIGTGSYLPEKVLTNKDLEKMVDTSDEWIVSRTGIRERRICSDKQAASDLGIEAARKALKNANVKVEDVDLLIVATITPDMFFPSTACIIQTELGIRNAAVFDLNAACAGFIYSLSTAQQFLQTGTYKTALVIATETLSKITDWKDRNTCVLLGDGAGAAVLREDKGDSGILSCYLDADGRYGDLLNMPAGGSRIPATVETVKNRLHYLKMRGNETFRIAIPEMIKSVKRGLERCGLKIEDVALLIPHQANIRIIKALAKRLSLPADKVFVNIDKCANTSAATVAIALDEANRQGRIKKGDIIELVAFGAGFTWGSCVIKW